MKKEDVISTIAFVIMMICAFMLYYIIREIGLK